MLADKPLLDLGSTPAQDVAIGISVRNALMHFKPQSVHLPFAETRVSTKGDWDRLCRKLAGRPIKPKFALAQQGRGVLPLEIVATSPTIPKGRCHDDGSQQAIL